MKLRLIALAAALPLLAACATTPPRPDIPFAKYGKGYASKPDLARVERNHPLTPDQRLSLTPANLATLTQEELDQVYARLTAGPIPDGPHQGTVIFADGGGLRRLKEILGGVKGFGADLGVNKLDRVAEMLWRGKVFYRDEMELRNQITHRRALGRLFKADVSAMRTETIDGRKVALLFPAKLYCGQSLLDSRRESVIIDYAFGNEIDGYLPAFDYVAGPTGLQIRDEIRMVRPGLYLGRAYIGKIFLLNFTLYNEDAAKAGITREDCRPGAQQVVRTAGR
ncbi:MAG TPA: hypothetical protein VN493_09200 [Thermoanaerobaculia bacterium]|nr:hypothetical protein [Thermoanaerobaculia bacterium]